MKVLIVDDHTLVRRGLAHVVKECFADAEVGEAGDADEAIEQLNSAVADIVLIDIRLPGRDGIQLLREVKKTWPDVPVVMLTTYDNAKFARKALAEGAAGYILKDASPADLDQAMRVALAGGGNVLSTRVIQNLFEEMESGGGKPTAKKGPPMSMTQREVDILELLVEGHSNRDIAQRLFLSEKTVKAHLASVFRKLGVTNRTQAAMAAVSMGIGPTAQSLGRAAGMNVGRST